MQAREDGYTKIERSGEKRIEKIRRKKTRRIYTAFFTIDRSSVGHKSALDTRLTFGAADLVLTCALRALHARRNLEGKCNRGSENSEQKNEKEKSEHIHPNDY
jgi:hypothetical protein